MIRDRIKPALVKGVATKHSLGAQPTTFNSAVLFYGFSCVVGTAGVEPTAWWQEWTNVTTV